MTHDPYFFGYGSLVNRTTHDFADLHPARLHGWRRSWWQTDLRQVAFLTAVRDENSAIDGMIAHVPGNDWAALDEREYAYDRLPATDAVTHSLADRLDIAVYAVPHRTRSTTNARHPILLSYLDVVVQGYLREMGTNGVSDFFATTDGWDTPILDDRADPRYPRHRKLAADETALVDHHLSAIGATLI